ncbi:Choline dehydrogenase [Methylobacterium phyllostachyos]|uniref:Choline dehydrogenase n=1 Tax=Methylobacterium phyllostachyos TaxID=582672 RepID=A0A1H0I5I3_9HYPH|nr:GMC oxidoreductase [Methylobacterium phyllostachyos]SDO26666.1 Choline dehydrogenase [Methylobacterium phyllostachyos]
MRFLDLENCPDGEIAQCGTFDLIVVGGGAAGLTIVRELLGQGLRIALVESGGFEQTERHEDLNAVEVSGDLLDPRLQNARRAFHGPQLKFWNEDTQRFGVRCRVLGGSTEGWAGKVAPFDEVDFETREWIADSGWPLARADLMPYLDRAAEHLDLGPLIADRGFWASAKIPEPGPIGRLQSFHPFFWQFARSRSHLTDVMRLGADFRSLRDSDVVVFLNATATSISVADQRVTGISVTPSLTGGKVFGLSAPHVVLSGGAIENARLLLVAKRQLGSVLGDAHDVIGRYLTDHPSVEIGSFKAEHRDAAAKILGFYPLQRNLRIYMYSHGLALRPERQRKLRLPNMAVFAVTQISEADPLVALARLGRGKSKNVIADLGLVLGNLHLVVTTLGRKLVNYRKIPLRLRRLIADAAVKIDANFVARDYQARGRGRKIDGLTIRLIGEQPPRPNNRVELSERCDRHGIPLARVCWSSDGELRAAIVRFAHLLSEDFAAAGLEGFELAPEVAGDPGRLLIHDMAHTAGTTRMGSDPKTSVVDVDCQLHDVAELYVAGASVFPTSGHANPTLMILALAIRLADHLRPRIAAARLEALTRDAPGAGERPLILVTGGTGNIGTEVVASLLAKGYRVRSTFRRRLPGTAGVDWVQVDFADPDLPQARLSALVDGVDGIINLAASLSDVGEMQVANVTTLSRLAEAARAAGIRYFCQASSIVVYGSPRTKLVDENSPVIDVNAPIEKQYFAENYMRHYARTKVLGEVLLRSFADVMRIDLCRIAVAQPPGFLDRSFQWPRARRLFSLYRNSHFIASRDVARALVHLTERALTTAGVGVEVYNVSDVNSPTYADHYRAAGRPTGFYLPVILDLLKGVVIGRTLQPRHPIGWFRVSGAKLQATGFTLGGQTDGSLAPSAITAPEARADPTA